MKERGFYLGPASSRDEKSPPQIGIILALFEPHIGWLEEQITSLLAQTHSNWVLVVYPDSPLTAQIANVLRQVPQDRLICLEHQGRLGSFRAFERALREAPPCDFYAYCDQDDIWLPQKLNELTVALSESGRDLVHSDLEIISEKGKTTDPSCWRIEKRNTDFTKLDLLIWRNAVTGCACLFRGELRSHLLPFPAGAEQIRLQHDHWTALVAWLLGGIENHPKPLIKYRQHQNNQIGAKPIRLAQKLGRMTDLRVFLGRAKIYWRKLVITQRLLEERFPEDTRVKASIFGGTGFRFFVHGLRFSVQNRKLCPYYIYGVIGLLMNVASSGQPRHKRVEA